jgi:hypothetical protein
MGCVPKLLQQLMPASCTDAVALPVCMSAACALMVITLAKEGKTAVFEVSLHQQHLHEEVCHGPLCLEPL